MHCQRSRAPTNTDRSRPLATSKSCFIPFSFLSVRSYGTEERETQYQIAPQNQIYDYILFRGSDIKDIRVVNNVPPVPNDPAIMQLTMPSQLGQQGFQPQFPVPVMGQLGAHLGQFGGQYNALSGLSGLTQGGQSGTIPGFGAAQQQQQQQQQINQTKKPSESECMIICQPLLLLLLPHFFPLPYFSSLPPHLPSLMFGGS